jgi:hypothetical protein
MTFGCVIVVRVVFSRQYSGTDFDPTELEFYINRGWRRGRNFWYIGRRASVSRTHIHARKSPHTPHDIAFQYPYVIAFEPTFVEIRNVETGSMFQVI